MYLILLWICSCAGSVVAAQPIGQQDRVPALMRYGGAVVFLCLDFKCQWWDRVQIGSTDSGNTGLRMIKQALISFGLLLAFGCANAPDKDKQLINSGCSESSDSISENRKAPQSPDDEPDDNGDSGTGESGGTGETATASKSAFFDSTNFDTSDFQD